MYQINNVTNVERKLSKSKEIDEMTGRSICNTFKHVRMTKPTIVATDL